MKILVLAAVLVAVALGRPPSSDKDTEEQSQWPWKVGTLYRYDVVTHTLAYHQEGASAGNTYRARVVVRAKAPGHLEVKLENPETAQIHQELKHHEPLPKDLVYKEGYNIDKPFEIFLVGGRVKSLRLPSSLSLAQENLIKGFVGALQVDLSTYRNVHSSHDTFDKNTKQGLFRKMETDVTGDCETLYTASPVTAEWRRELPEFAADDEPIEITKSKNYGHCHHRVDYHFGVPEGAEWTGTAHSTKKEQFINRATVSRILVGKEGPIYKAETTSTVNVNPHLYGKQRAEVHSKVSVRLVSYEQDSEPEWPKLEGAREILNLLYSLTPKQVNIDDSSASSESFEKDIHIESYQRERRSAKPKSVFSIDKVIRKNHVSNEGSSSSSSESASAYVNDDIPHDNEPAYAALYMNPQPHGDKKQNPMNAQKLVQEMAHQLQNTNNMPKADFLSKFNILLRVISSMSYGQLSQTSRSIEIAKSSNDIVKTDMWMIYRDAVAQAGTMPAFQQIRTWIEKKTMEGEEAAEVVAVLSRSLRYPTTGVMRQFFELAMSPVVTEQSYLNSSALLAATKFINMGHVNNETAHRFYPTHMYGRLSRKHDRFVVDEILPRLSQELNQAIEKEDSHKAQVYVRAIGNLGHRAILDVFAPYLEGKIAVSTYLRTRMVENLHVVAYQGDHHVRAVLFSILKNTAEPYEVRVAAIHNIFMNRPTTAMMQAMAEMTKEDPSIHVRAVLKSVILSAAELKNPRYFHLSQTAAAVRDMVTKEHFGMQYSSKKATEFLERDDEWGITNFVSSIGSKDTLCPKSWKSSWKNRVGGWDDETSFSWAVSRKVYDYFINTMFAESNRDRSAEFNHKYSANKISEMFNINLDDKESLQASLYFDFMQQQRLFAFGENDIKDLAIKWAQFLQKLTNGIDVHYTKVINRNKISVMFPLASGMPFVYRYKEPAVIHVQGKVQGKVEFLDREDHKMAITLDKDIRITYAENHDGKAGFLDPLGNQYAVAGLVSKFQVNIPLKLKLEMKQGDIKAYIRAAEPEQDSTLVHYSVWPYTASQKKDSIVPFALDPTTKVISRPNKVVSIDYKFGQQIGSPFQLQGYSYSEDYRNIFNIVRPNDFMSSLITALKQRDVAQTHFNFRYLGKQAKSKGVLITGVYDTRYNLNNEGQMPETAAETSDATPNSPSRRDELIKRVTSGINTARATVWDLSAKFDLPQKQEYVFTAAIGDSHVDPKVQFAFFAGRNSDQPNQFNAVGTLKKPASISPMNFKEALQKELKMEFEADIRYNKKENIHIHGSTERTKKYVEELQKQPWAKECEEEIATGNFYQRACHSAIVLAHAPDSFKFGVLFKDVNPLINNGVYQVFKIAEVLGLWQLEETPQKLPRDGKLDIDVNLSYLTKTMSLELFHSFYGRMRVKNVPIPEVTPAALATYWPIKPHERVFNHYKTHQYLPMCSVDDNKVRTFSDRAYDYKLSRSWHVVMLDDRHGSNEDLVVLARRPSEKRQDIYISYSSHTGKHVEIELQPAEGQHNYNVKVNTNAKKVAEGALTTYWDEVDKKPILEYYKEGDVLILEIREERLRLMYDGHRFTLMSDQRRNKNRGICGYMSGEPRDDYRTPNGVIDKPEYYGVSYALIDGESDPKDKELQVQAKKVAYQPRNKFTAILKSDEEWANQMRLANEEEWGAEIIYKSRNYLKSKERCDLKPQVQYYENHGEICITTNPLPACQSHCSGEEFRIQATQVVCKSKLDEQFRSHKDLIRQGQSPKVTGVAKITQYRVPSSCKA
ncbi:vitellogenin-like [Maniola hyperantus]|uniref:vitellogenin-like n=1 Tax=Aphantopus hyperantus TaxID=2795564 RepID=UPI0015697B7E|nr:vitellogenin-like [Maniola hyperantus]